MKIDFKDIEILQVMYENSEPQTIYEITKSFYPGKKGFRELSDKSATIRARLKKFLEYGFLIETKESKKSFYSLDKSKIKFSDKSVLKIGNKKYCFGKVMAIKLKKENNDWLFFQFT